MSHALMHRAIDLTRKDFTVSEILALQDQGILSEDDNFELVDGEIVPMQSKTHRHEIIKSDLIVRIARALPDTLWMGVESSMYLSERVILEPDIVVYPRGLQLESVKGSDIILAIEVALTTLRFDLGRKAALYARHGVQELWVIDANCALTHVHRGASPDGWTSIDILPEDAVLSHPALPAFTARLDAV